MKHFFKEINFLDHGTILKICALKLIVHYSKNQLNFNFYLPNPLSSEIITFEWSNNTCGQASDILEQLTQNTFACNTHNTYSLDNIINNQWILYQMLKIRHTTQT
ncbi:unnamed protein product [Paramecium pentaurelia]|uniref:Uncharacterized protein n=1 Tax=Paramecium pentaurelia TaxID=43138 RepID=A0A8S1U9D8_9CILI|nr:unnamed protein product [Paramecium pentaurelia]